jgi:hypothetical protein
VPTNGMVAIPMHLKKREVKDRNDFYRNNSKWGNRVI